MEDSNMELVAVNDLVPISNLAYLLKYDTAYGRYNKEVKTGESSLIIDGREIKVYSEKNPADFHSLSGLDAE